MKKIVATAALILVTMAGALAQTATTVVVKNNKSAYVVKDNDKCTFTFELTASKETVASMEEKAKANESRYAYDMTEHKDGSYTVTLNVKIGSGIHVVQRCLATLGISEVTFEGNKYNVYELQKVVDQLK